jgi:membrane protease YdiL (CAAX protease family)
MSRLATFYGIAFAWAVVCGLVPAVGRIVAPGVPQAAWFTMAGVPMMFGPLVSAVLAGRREGIGFAEATGFRWAPNRWWVVAWLAPALLVAATILASAALPGVDLAVPLDAFRATYRDTLPADAFAEAEAQLAAVPPAVVALAGGLAGLVAGGTINAAVAFGEEAGWRGYVPRALMDAPFWPAALGSGALWGLWHAPLVLQGYNYGDEPVAGLATMTVACAAMTPPLLWLRGRAGSTVAAALFHGTLNGVAGLVPLFLIGGGPVLAGPLGWGAVAALAVADVALLAAVPPRARMREVMGEPTACWPAPPP